MPQDSHFEAGVMWRVEEGQPPNENTVEFLVIEYSEAGRSGTTIKFPGGTNRKNQAESPIDTLRREWEEETFLKIVRCRPNPTMSVKKGPNHTQNFFVLDPGDCEGQLRTEPRTEVEVGRPTEFLGPPMWVSARHLFETMFPPHRKVLEQIFPQVLEYILSLKA